MVVRATEAEIDVVRTNPADAIAVFREAVIPALHEEEGYEGCYVLLSEEGKMLVLSFWTSNEAARASRLEWLLPGPDREVRRSRRLPPGAGT